MRIGIDIRLQHETGVGRYIRNLTKLLQQLDKSNKYVLINPSISWHSLHEQLKMPGIIHRHHLDLMHFPYFNVPYRYNGPFVVTIHDLIINDFDTGRSSTKNILLYKLKRIGYFAVLSHALRASRAIITPSEATKQSICAHYPHIRKEKIFVTYEGIDQKITSANQQIENTTIQQLEASSYFLYVGNAYPHKNLEFLITAYKQFGNNAYKLVLVGKMNYFYFRLLNFIKSLHLEGNVILTGEVTDGELSYLYAHAKAAVLPSKMEGFALPALEAMQHNCLVLASDIPVFKEILEDRALYFSLN